jgi:hypothetical protein
MKEWPRAWKVNLIEQTNPHWEDLYPSLPGVKPVIDGWFLGALDPGNKCRDDD